jgi:quinol monooxygenase YgiN
MSHKKIKNNSMISIVAKFIVNEGEEKKFLDLVNELGIASRAEMGCVEYILHKDVEKPQTYCILEKWKDQASIDEHNNTHHFTRIVPQIIKIAKAEIDVYKPV